MVNPTVTSSSVPPFSVSHHLLSCCSSFAHVVSSLLGLLSSSSSGVCTRVFVCVFQLFFLFGKKTAERLWSINPLKRHQNTQCTGDGPLRLTCTHSESRSCSRAIGWYSVMWPAPSPQTKRLFHLIIWMLNPVVRHLQFLKNDKKSPPIRLMSVFSSALVHSHISGANIESSCLTSSYIPHNHDVRFVDWDISKKQSDT